MSEAELHVLRARLRGGILNKARRGELEVRLPIGFVYDAQQRVRLDPDARVQESVRQLFRTFRRTGSATATVKAFREQGLAFPRRVFHGPHKGEVLWGELGHHPRYAGAFCFGRSRQRHHPDGHTICVRLPCERLRRREVEQARYQSDLARRRYLQVDPDNRLVADWNTALRALVQAQEHYEHQRQTEAAGLTAAQRASILALAQDFPRLWHDPQTPDRERKRMARLLIADVTLLKATELTAQVRFHGGATHTVHLPLSKPAWLQRQTSPCVVTAIDALLDDYTDAETAEQLNRQGLTAGEGGRFHRLTVARLRTAYALRTRYARLRARGLLTQAEIAARLDVAPATIKNRRRAGLLVAHRYDDKGQCLFEPPGPEAPKKFQHQGKTISQSARSTPDTHPTTV
jgi:hypothetical protein